MDLPKQQPEAVGPEKSGSAADLQLELEFRAFAELLLDIYEAGYLPKGGTISPPAGFDDHFKAPKMR